MRYVEKQVYIVKSSDGRVIHKVFGTEQAAEDYVGRICRLPGDDMSVIDQWPVEFEVELN